MFASMGQKPNTTMAISSTYTPLDVPITIAIYMLKENNMLVSNGRSGQPTKVHKSSPGFLLYNYQT